MTCCNWILTILAVVVGAIALWPGVIAGSLAKWIIVLLAVLIVIVSWTMCCCKICGCGDSCEAPVKKAKKKK